jgi:hypothetical protein
MSVGEALLDTALSGVGWVAEARGGDGRSSWLLAAVLASQVVGPAYGCGKAVCTSR